MEAVSPCHPCHLGRRAEAVSDAAPPQGLRLTKRTVDALACPPGRKDVLFFDAELKGFAVRITAQGTKVFLFQYRAGGAVRRLVIGEYGNITPEQARKRAEVLRGQVKAGADPKAEHEAARRAAAAAEAEGRARAAADALTFAVLVTSWRDIHLANRRPSYRDGSHRALMLSFAGWKQRPAHGIRPAEAVAELDRIRKEKGPGAARKAYALGRAMFAWAMRRQMLAGNPFAAIQAPEPVADRDRVLSDGELAAVWHAAGTLGWPMGTFTRVAILTLQRRDEVAGMRWAELSEDGTTWILPAERAKNGKAHVVHLAPAVREILQAVPQLSGSPLVFTTTGKTPVSGFSRAKAMMDAAIVAARRKAGMEPVELPDWRLHDFRRTGVTRLAALGFAPHVCDRLLNHVEGTIRGVAAVYQRAEFLPERQAALEAWARHVLAVTEGKARAAEEAGSMAKVVPLDAARRRRPR